MGGAVPMHIRKERNEVLRTLGAQKKAEFYQRHSGSTRLVLTEMCSEQGMAEGFTDNYIRVRFPKTDNTPNQLIPVQLKSTYDQEVLVGSVMN
jgi:threonylcarbamoyladenosine tRNA methylthiotransferase MtaB